MNSACEALFRIGTPNSTPRAVKVIALDAGSKPVVADLAERHWNGAAFFTAADLVSDPTRLREETSAADLVVMIATAGDSRATWRSSARPAVASESRRRA